MQLPINVVNMFMMYLYFRSQLEIDDGWEVCYGSLEFNTTKFPNIKATTDAIKRKGFRVALWIHPFINKDCEPYYSNALNAGYLVLDHNNNASTQWWRSDNDYKAAYVDVSELGLNFRIGLETSLY